MKWTVGDAFLVFMLCCAVFPALGVTAYLYYSKDGR